MNLIDLTEEFIDVVRDSRGTVDFRARFWSWLDRQNHGGPLAPLITDMERHWASVGEALSHSEARDLLRQLTPARHAERVAAIGRRFGEITGAVPDVDVILLAGLERPEGYSRFEHGRNTIFLGLDHPTALAHDDHLEVILSHELCHAVRDPDPGVLRDYGGAPAMSHDDFVARHPFREHLVSESLATSVSHACYPNRPDRRYVYFEEKAIEWCEAHRREIAERMLLALERAEPYRTFYSEGSVTPDSPDCCDYWFGLHLGRYALEQVGAGAALRTPSSAFLDRFVGPFLDRFLGRSDARAVARTRSSAPTRARKRLPVTPAGDDPLSGSSLPASVRHVYEEYGALLSRRPGLARKLEEQFTETVRAEGLEHAGKAWAVHAFPLLLSAEEERHLRWATDGLSRVIERVIEMFRQDPEVRAFFGFPRGLEELCLLDPGYRPYVTLGRFDSYWSGRRVRFLELNANGAALWCIADVLATSVANLTELGDILERHDAAPRSLTARMLDGVLSAWHQARGDAAVPRRIALVDWKDVATSSEQQRLARHFTSMGVPTDVVDPRQLVFENGELRGPAGAIDLVYRRLTTLDLLDRHDEIGALIDAAKAAAVVTVGAFASDVAHSKRLFAFLTNERWQRSFSPAERALIDAHVPWTRVFGPGKTQYEGRRRELLELALAERERFVVKPAESYEGRGVLLGAETPPRLWEAELRRRYGAGHVIQEVVQAPLRTLLLPRRGQVERVQRWLHLGEFVIGGRLAGFVARTSEELVLSADSQERVLPTLVLNDDDGAGLDQDLGPASP